MNAQRIVSVLVTATFLAGPATVSLAQQSPSSSPTLHQAPAMPSSGPPQRIAGAIQSIGSTRTNRVIEVSDIKVEVEPSTVILVGCQPGSMADLNQGSKIKAAYEVKEPNRNVATVIEAEH